MSYMICTYHIDIYFRLNVIYTYIINYTIKLTYICKFYILDLSRSEKDVEFDLFFFFPPIPLIDLEFIIQRNDSQSVVPGDLGNSIT